MRRANRLRQLLEKRLKGGYSIPTDVAMPMRSRIRTTATGRLSPDTWVRLGRVSTRLRTVTVATDSASAPTFCPVAVAQSRSPEAPAKFPIQTLARIRLPAKRVPGRQQTRKPKPGLPTGMGPKSNFGVSSNRIVCFHIEYGRACIFMRAAPIKSTTTQFRRNCGFILE